MAVDERAGRKRARACGRATLLALTAAFALGGCFGSDDESSRDDGSQAPNARAGADANRANDGPRANDEAGGAAGGGAASSGSPSGGIEPAATRAELIRRADRACAAAQARIRERSSDLRRLLQRVGRGKVSKDAYQRRSARLTSESREAVLDTLATLRALGRPRGRQEALDEYLSATAAHARVTGEIADALERGRQAELARLNREWLKLAEAAHNAARAYGFKVCGGN